MSRKTLLSIAAAITVSLTAFTSTSASAGNYGYNNHYVSHSCHKKAVRVPYWRTVWTHKRISVPYGCGYKTIKVRRTVKRYKTIWRKSCH